MVDTKLQIQNPKSDIAISVRNLSKKYQLYETPKHRLKEALHPFRKKYHRDFWALRDISFEVKRGEALGIIGRNGAGKSTLLQIICGTMLPTHGEVEVNGRVTALLELGAGFNPEFTGKENVYINAAIIGLSHIEMDEKYQEIIDFAEIGDFIDQPVKTYSSGMYVRLAFACAVNVDPDILIIDEALAVGDAKFQKKCYDKMNAFKDKGKTIILVTHSRIKGFASKGLLVNEGQNLYFGDSGEADLRYMKLLYPKMEESAKKQIPAETSEVKKTSEVEKVREIKSKTNQYCLEVIPGKDAKSFGAGGAWINSMKIFGLERPNVFHGGERIKIEVSYSWDQEQIRRILQKELIDSNLIFGIAFENKKGIIITGLVSTSMNSKDLEIDPLKEKNCILEYKVDVPFLFSDDYFLSPGISLGKQGRSFRVKKYNNLVHLCCYSKKKWIFGLMNWPVCISKGESK